jgi:hypothetical protein
MRSGSGKARRPEDRQADWETVRKAAERWADELEESFVDDAEAAEIRAAAARIASESYA